MNNVVTLGKQQITELLQTYNKGVKSTFGLQKSRHQFAQALGFANWFELEAQLDDSSSQILSPNISAKHHRLSDQYLAFSVRLPEYKLAENFKKFLMIRLQGLTDDKAVNWMDRRILDKTLLETLTEGYAEDELHMAPKFYEVMEWYEIEPDFNEEDVYTFAFDYGSWDDNLVRDLAEKVIKPAFNRFLEISCLEGAFLSAEIFREYKYHVESPV